MQRSIGDARDALINVCVDVLSAYKASQTSGPQGLLAPMNLRLLPLYVAALLKSVRDMFFLDFPPPSITCSVVMSLGCVENRTEHSFG